MNTPQFDLLKSKRFLPLFMTQFLGAFNDNIFKNALIILITYRIAGLAGLNSQMLVTVAAGIFILPFFLFSATAGQLADKYEKSRLISIIKLAEIVLMGLATLGFYFQNISMLLLVLFLLGIQAAFFGPLKYAILPYHLRENELIAGNGLIEAGTFLSILLGTILGGILILEPKGDYFISFSICLVSICGFLSSLFIPKTSTNQQVKVKYNFFRETIRVIQYSKQRSDIYLCILGISWFWLFGATFLAEFPGFTKDILKANEHVITFFLALFSIGIAAGSLLCNKLLKGKVHATFVPLGALGMTIFTVDLYFAANHFQAMKLINLTQFLQTFSGVRISLDLLCIAICSGIYTVPLYAILQQRSDETHRARTIASNNIMNALFMVLSACGTLVMLKMGLTINQVFLVLAVLNGAVAIYICQLLPDILIKSSLRWVLKLFYKVKVVGLEHYLNAGNRVVIVANHTSFLDAALLAAFLPDKLTYAVNTHTAQKGWIKFFLRMVDAFPLNPTNPMALKSLIGYVKDNKRCVIFPEGRITMTGALMKIYEGPGLVADKSGGKILPIRIQGAQFTPFSRLKGKVRIRWMPKITLTIFPAQSFDIPMQIKGRNRRQHIGLKLYDLMTEVIFESSNYHQTLFSSLIDAKSTHGRHHKIVEDIERTPITYQQFLTRCFILGKIIAKKSHPQERIGILLPNMVPTALTFFSMQAYGRVPAMLNFSTGIKNVVCACQTAEIKTVYTSIKFIQLAKLNEMIEALKNSGVTIVFLETMKSSISLFDRLAGLVKAQFPRLSHQLITRDKLNPESTAVILFTSGSEGMPKAVDLSHKNIQANRYQLSACVDFTKSDKIFNALPVFHSFGLTGGMLLPMLSGVKVFFYPSPLHYRIVPELSYDTNATILFGTDTFLSGYAKYAHQYDFYSVRYVFAGAEKLRDETRTLWLQKFGVRIFEGYGTTETSPVLATNTPMQNKPGTVGRLLPGIKYRLKPVEGIDEGGVLMVSGPNVMKGYLLWDKPGYLVAPENGWYETGDIVSIDDLGYVIIKGRVKRFAKLGGEMVSLTMVEQQINALWTDFQHAVVNIPDPKKGEQLVLVTTCPFATREAIIHFFKTNGISEISIPKKIFIQKQLPLLGTGKVDYTSLKEWVCKQDIVVNA